MASPCVSKFVTHNFLKNDCHTHNVFPVIPGSITYAIMMFMDCTGLFLFQEHPTITETPVFYVIKPFKSPSIFCAANIEIQRLLLC